MSNLINSISSNRYVYLKANEKVLVLHHLLNFLFKYTKSKFQDNKLYYTKQVSNGAWIWPAMCEIPVDKEFLVPSLSLDTAFFTCFNSTSGLMMLQALFWTLSIYLSKSVVSPECHVSTVSWHKAVQLLTSFVCNNINMCIPFTETSNDHT
jgi:hypothetical protein